LKIILLLQVEHSGSGSVVDTQVVSGFADPLEEGNVYKYFFCSLFIDTLCGSSFPLIQQFIVHSALPIFPLQQSSN
jgi:hypothetical protein